MRVMSFSQPLSRGVGLGLLLSLGVLSACGEQKGVNKLGLENPLVLQRADPWAYRTEEGRYYFTATVPEFNRIELREADHLAGLGSANPQVIWRKHWQGPMSNHIWAPELHRIEGTWYIYFSAGTAGGNYDVRPYVLSNRSDNPMTGEWTEEGRIHTRYDAFALDATTFEWDGQRYLIWSQKDPDDTQPASLHISAMASPTELTGPEILIAQPEYEWEKQGIPANQGASVLIRNGRILVTYTASATDHRSAIGLLWADADADLLDPASWNKRAEPVFTTHSESNRQGPGHASFTKTNDGSADVMLYHSREYQDLHGDELADPNRHTRARLLRWDDAGWPLFESDRSD